MSGKSFDPHAYMDAVAPALGLEIAPDYAPQVATFLGIAKGMADILDAAPIPEDDLHLAPVFDPGADDGEMA